MNRKFKKGDQVIIKGKDWEFTFRERVLEFVYKENGGIFNEK